MKQAAYKTGTIWNVTTAFFSSSEEANACVNPYGNTEIIWPAKFRINLMKGCPVSMHNEQEYELELVVPE